MFFSEDIIGILEDYIYDPQIHTYVNFTKYNNLEGIKWLDTRKNIEHPTLSSMRLAIDLGYIDIVKYFYYTKNIRNLGTDYVLYYPIYNGHLEVVEFLVNECGYSPHSHLAIECAYKREHYDIFLFLIDSIRNVNILYNLSFKYIGYYYDMKNKEYRNELMDIALRMKYKAYNIHPLRHDINLKHKIIS